MTDTYVTRDVINVINKIDGQFSLKDRAWADIMTDESFPEEMKDFSIVIA